MIRNRKGLKPNLPPAAESVVSSSGSAKATVSTSSQRWGCLWNVSKFCLLTVLLPPFLNYVSLIKEEQHLKPVEGELYDVGWGQRLFLRCTGTGEPTVVLDAPTGMTSDTWYQLAPMLSKLTRVCVYDRAGLGFSERPAVQAASSEQASTVAGTGDGELAPSKRSQPFTAERMAEDLHRLLTEASQQPQPFVMVGSGVGALVAKFYAHFYDGEVAAVVLVDPPVDQLFADRRWTDHWFGDIVPTVQMLQLLAASGLSRLAIITGLMKGPIAQDDASDPLLLTRQKFLMCYPRHLKSVVDEHYLMNDTLTQLRILGKVKPFPGNISVAVVTRDVYDERLPHLNGFWRDTCANAKVNLNLPQATRLTLPLNEETYFYEGAALKRLHRLIADVVVKTRGQQLS